MKQTARALDLDLDDGLALVATHKLKSLPPSFVAVNSGQKTHELRYNDRGYQVGDYLRLCEFNPYELPAYTGREITVGPITHLSVVANWVEGVDDPRWVILDFGGAFTGSRIVNGITYAAVISFAWVCGLGIGWLVWGR